MQPRLRSPAVALLGAALLAAAAAQPAADPADPAAAADGATTADAAEPDPFADLPPQEAAVERLLSERGEPAEFEAAVAAARAQQVPEQVLLEARFLYHVDRREDDRLAALLPAFLERRDSFRLEDSAIFALRDDWLAVIEYLQAIDALRKGDQAGFKRHITEAFWLSPRQGAAFASHIERFRTEQAMREIRIDFSTRLPPLDGGEPTELAALLPGRKALVFHFWSPWSRECEEFAEDFAATARVLDRNGIAVASLLAETGPRVIEDASRFVAQFPGLPCHWLRDDGKRPLHELLRIQSVPVVVLVSDDGRILYNGHPADPAYWDALQTVVPELERPALPPVLDNP